LQPGDASAVSSAHRAAGTSLLYLSNVRTNDVEIYSYPTGRMLGKLSGFGKPRAECADGQGDVWIVDTQALQISEYEAGGTEPVTALSTAGIPSGCAVTPNGNTVAVAGAFQGGAPLMIFHRSARKRWRDPRTYIDSSLRAGAFCGYDSHGDLFVDGLSRARHGTFALAELVRGASTLSAVTVNQAIAAPGQVQWDGTYLAVGDSGVSPSLVYQFSISASAATLAGTTALGGTQSVAQFWIDGARIIGPDFNRDVEFWKYPQGGSPVKTLDVPGYGAAVSE
jgi:hypothetical protein